MGMTNGGIINTASPGCNGGHLAVMMLYHHCSAVVTNIFVHREFELILWLGNKLNKLSLPWSSS